MDFMCRNTPQQATEDELLKNYRNTKLQKGRYAPTISQVER